MVCKTSKARGTIFHINKVKQLSLLEKSRLQYFYHSPSSKLPIRDVLGEQNMGEKKEPHIEIGAENYWVGCFQRHNIIPFVKNNEKYLFLMTTCRRKELKEFYGKKYIVGYITKEIVGKHRSNYFIKGKTFLYSFKDSIPIKKLGYSKFTRVKLIDKKDANIILQHFKNKKSILKDCINEIKRLDKDNITCLRKQGFKCPFYRECLRWNK